MNREELAEQNMNLIYLVLNRLELQDKEEEYYDLGLIGLTKAINTFDENKEIAFSTYAYKCIKNEILKEFQNEQTDKRKVNYECISLNDLVRVEKNNNRDLDYFSLIDSPYNLEEEIIQQEKKELLDKALNQLSYEEILLIELYYGINGMPKLEEDQIGRILGYCSQWVSTKKQKTIKKN